MQKVLMIGNNCVHVNVPDENIGSYVRYPSIGLTILPSMINSKIGGDLSVMPVIYKTAVPLDLVNDHSTYGSMFNMEQAARILDGAPTSPTIGRLVTFSKNKNNRKAARKAFTDMARQLNLDANGRPLTWFAKLCNKVRTWLKI